MFMPSADNPYFQGKFDPIDFEEIITPKTPPKKLKKSNAKALPSIDEIKFMPHETRL